MTPDELKTVEVGSNVRLRSERGRVTQCTRTWFMVVWEHRDPEIISRASSILTGRIDLVNEPPPSQEPTYAIAPAAPERRRRADIDD